MLIIWLLQINVAFSLPETVSHSRNIFDVWMEIILYKMIFVMQATLGQSECEDQPVYLGGNTDE